MPKFIIEREMPTAGAMTDADWQQGATKSNEVIHEMASDVQWIESYVANDKIYCVYIAPNADLIREHGRKSGFPVDRVSKVERVVDPTTAEMHTMPTTNRPEQSQMQRQ